MQNVEWTIHSLHKWFWVTNLCPILDTGEMAVNKTDVNPWLHDVTMLWADKQKTKSKIFAVMLSRIKLWGKQGEGRWNGGYRRCYLRCGVRWAFPGEKAFGQKPESSEEGGMALSRKHIPSDGDELGTFARFRGWKEKEEEKKHWTFTKFKFQINKEKFNLGQILKKHSLCFWNLNMTGNPVLHLSGNPRLVCLRSSKRPLWPEWRQQGEDGGRWGWGTLAEGRAVDISNPQKPSSF